MRADVTTLTRDDALSLIARHHVGRIGTGLHDLIRVELTPYLYADDWIYVRTGVGTDLDIIRRHPWAAFQVDEIESVSDWRSAEVTGTVEVLTSDPEADADHRFEFEQAVRLLRNAVPDILTAADVYPERVQVLRIHVDTILGRESRTIEGAKIPDGPRTAPSE
jgi:nitroimidazol reductase NimA-like FMN-containing flavoprotein (pyridoxamine 5'-phosphate oxidase superfamily)